jgi:2-oxo-4-hydroxy-4-carboxy-5-ureidoimidazoline decarboxylase
MNVRPARPAGDQEQARLADLNALPEEAARQALKDCCASPRWAAAVAAGRPYASVAGLLRQSDAAVAGLEPADLRDALSGHPRIGERSAGKRSADHQTAGQQNGNDADRSDSDADRWSRAEQAGMDGAAALTKRALADGNEAYERRFGHIYLVCATGRTAADLLAVLSARLENDPDTEWGVVRSELQKINRIRLGKLLGGAR